MSSMLIGMIRWFLDLWCNISLKTTSLEIIDFADDHFADNVLNEQPGDPRPAHHHTDALAGAQCWQWPLPNLFQVEWNCQKCDTLSGLRMSSSEEIGIISRIPHICRFNSNAIAIPQPIESSGEDQKGKFSGTGTGTGTDTETDTGTDTGTGTCLALVLAAISKS